MHARECLNFKVINLLLAPFRLDTRGASLLPFSLSLSPAPPLPPSKFQFCFRIQSPFPPFHRFYSPRHSPRIIEPIDQHISEQSNSWSSRQKRGGIVIRTLLEASDRLDLSVINAPRPPPSPLVTVLVSCTGIRCLGFLSDGGASLHRIERLRRLYRCHDTTVHRNNIALPRLT